MKNNKTKKQKEWVDMGSGCGRMRDPSAARSEEQIIKSAQELRNVISKMLNDIESLPSVISAYWYVLQSINDRVAIARKNLEDDLFHFGVIVPEKFDWKPLEDFLWEKRIEQAKKNKKKDK